MPNSHLLQFYGFVVPDNPYDSVTIQYDLDASDPFLDEKKALFKEHGLMYVMPRESETACLAGLAQLTHPRGLQNQV
jgi:hypothetical protein